MQCDCVSKDHLPSNKQGWVWFSYFVSKMSWKQVYGQVWMKINTQWKAAAMAEIASCVHKDRGDEKKCSSLLTETCHVLK